jgi:uncharacterized membrane protein
MIKLNFVPGWPWLVGAGALAAALLLLSYALAVGRPKWWLRMTLLTVRWLVIAAVAFCLLDPHRVEEVRREQAAPVAVLLDCSRSMSIPDVADSRLGAARAWLHEQVLPRWPAGVPRSLFAFSQALEPLASPDTASPTGGVTSLAGALEHLLAIPREDPLAAVILCSDGIDTAQGDPLALAKVFRRKGIPIYTASFGTRQEPRDIGLDNLQVKRAVPNQAPTRIGLSLRSPGFPGLTVPVQIRYRNQVVASQEVRLTGGEQRVEMDFTPRQKGYQIYEVTVPLQTGEWLAYNNRRAFGLEVVDPTIHVIYMEGTPMQSDAPIPEWKYLKDALESDKNIKVKVLYQPLSGAAEGGSFRRTVDADPQTGEKAYAVNHPTRGFPRTMAELLQHDVVIHSDIKTQFFTAEQLQNMAAFVEQHGGGFVMVGGNSAFGKGGYQKTIIDRIIPVAMQQFADSAKLVFQMQVPPEALAHPIMALGATREETTRIWTQKLPVLYGFNRVDRAKPGAVVLATTPAQGLSYGSGNGQKVVLAVQEIGKGRSMAFPSDTTRTWGADFETRWGEPLNPSYAVDESNCDSRYYRAFWINAVRWLAAGKVSKTNSAVTLELARSYSLPGQSTSGRIMVRDPEARPLSGAEVALVLSADGLNVATNRAAFDPASLSYLVELHPLGPGRYTATATASLQGRKLGDDQQLLVCEETDREMAEVRARPDLMAEVARLSGGKDLTDTLDDAAALASMFERVPPATVNYRRTPLWDNGWWMAAIFALLTAEWVVRRLKGLA